MKGNPKHIVIVGMSRSGTSLLYSMMTNALKEYEFKDGEISALSLKPMHKTISKRPLDCLALDQILELNDREVRVIFCVRDPRDVICSVHKNVPHDYFIGFLNQYFVIPEKNICQLTNPGLLQIIQSYMRHRDKVLCVKYEDLTQQTEQTMKKINLFIDEEMRKDDFSLNEQSQVPNGVIAALNGIRKVDAMSVEQWKKHPWRVWSEFSNHPQMHDIMAILDYERDKKWFINHFKRRLPL